MGAYRNGAKQGQPYRNGVRMNAYRNGVRMFESGPPFEGFGMVVNSGDDSQFILPLRYGGGTAQHDLTIAWGDGVVQEVTGTAGITAQYQGLAHGYPAANTEYEIRITGTTYLGTAEDDSYFGLGFAYSGNGYCSSTNKIKVKSLFGSPDYLTDQNMASRDFCYSYMFQSCAGLTKIPSTLLPATALAQYCYSGMFYNCTGLTEIPATLLPATTLADSCYGNMFGNCSDLTYIYMSLDWFTGKTAQNYMFNNCTSITANTPYANIPSGWK